MKCSTCPCPKCQAPSPCVDHVEVDIGVGIQTFDHEWQCPAHGLWADGDTGPIFRDEP